MKRLFLVAVTVLSAYLFSAGAVCSAPVEVTFYPQAAQVREVKKVTLKKDNSLTQQAVLIIPGQADPDTLTTKITAPTSLTVLDQRWRQIVRQDEDTVQPLKKKLTELKKEQQRLQGDIKAVETQIQFWQLQTKAKVKTVNDAGNFSTAIGRNIKKMVQDKLALETHFEDITKKIKELQEELNSIAGKKETSWEVTIYLAGPTAAEATLTYSYTLTGCGWSSLYRLEAQPLSKRIRFTWDAEIWQSSGQEWRNVNIRLATLQPRTQIAPPDIPPWIIKPRERFVYREQKSVRAAPLMREAAGASDDEASGTAAPLLNRESTFHVWEIGKRSLGAGQRLRTAVREEVWPVEFIYLARPSQGDQAFVRGNVQFQEDKEIPEGTASFLIDGALVGKRPFSFSGREATVYFGIDPLIKATTLLLAKASGEKTLFADKQTHRWEWRIDISNGRNHPVQIRLEEPLPQARDERIQLTLKSDPEASEKAVHNLIWNIEVPAGGKKQVLNSVTLEAPKNLPLDLGWRR